MVVRDLQLLFDSWAPKELAWERDNVGLQVGYPDEPVKRILVALDCSDAVIREAVRRKATLIITHHPLLYHPLKSVTGNDPSGRLVLKLVRHGVALFSAHTNLDFTRSGVSIALAERIGLKRTKVLMKSAGTLRKIVVFVPAEHADAVMSAMADSGAGRIGEYESCSFRAEGTGTFRGSAKTKPFLGRAGRLERVNETRLEMIVPRWHSEAVVQAMLAAHPYEEPAYDVYELANGSPDTGAGAIGDLEPPGTLSSFLKHAAKVLHAGMLRYAGDLRQKVHRVAVCGGSGSDLIRAAAQQGADVFMTADMSYHAFQRAEDSLALVDAGHYETEFPVVEKIVSFLQKHVAEVHERVQVYPSKQSLNPVKYYLS